MFYVDSKRVSREDAIKAAAQARNGKPFTVTYYGYDGHAGDVIEKTYSTTNPKINVVQEALRRDIIFKIYVDSVQVTFFCGFKTDADAVRDAKKNATAFCNVLSEIFVRGADSVTIGGRKIYNVTFTEEILPELDGSEEDDDQDQFSFDVMPDDVDDELINSPDSFTVERDIKGNYSKVINGEYVSFKNHSIVYIDAIKKLGLEFHRDDAGKKRFFTVGSNSTGIALARGRKAIAAVKVAQFYADRLNAENQATAIRKFFLDEHKTANNLFFQTFAVVTYADGREHNFSNSFDNFNDALHFVHEFKANFSEPADIFIQTNTGSASKVIFYRNQDGVETFNDLDPENFKRDYQFSQAADYAAVSNEAMDIAVQAEIDNAANFKEETQMIYQPPAAEIAPTAEIEHTRVDDHTCGLDAEIADLEFLARAELDQINGGRDKELHLKKYRDLCRQIEECKAERDSKDDSRPDKPADHTRDLNAELAAVQAEKRSVMDEIDEARLELIDIEDEDGDEDCLTPQSHIDYLKGFIEDCLQEYYDLCAQEDRLKAALAAQTAADLKAELLSLEQVTAKLEADMPAAQAEFQELERQLYRMKRERDAFSECLHQRENEARHNKERIAEIKALLLKDSLTRAAEDAFNRYINYAHDGKLTAAEFELQIYNALRHTLKEVA